MPKINPNSRGMECKETCTAKKEGKCTRDMIFTRNGKCLDKNKDLGTEDRYAR